MIYSSTVIDVAENIRATVDIQLNFPMDKFGAELIREIDKAVAIVSVKHDHAWFPGVEHSA